MMDVLEAIEAASDGSGWIVASSKKIPAVNQPGDNPPHALARARYEEIAADGFLCTGDDEESDDPIVFEVSTDGISLVGGPTSGETSGTAAAIEAARGGEKPHGETVGFGST